MSLGWRAAAAESVSSPARWSRPIAESTSWSKWPARRADSLGEPTAPHRRRRCRGGGRPLPTHRARAARHPTYRCQPSPHGSSRASSSARLPASLDTTTGSSEPGESSHSAADLADSTVRMASWVIADTFSSAERAAAARSSGTYTLMRAMRTVYTHPATRLRSVGNSATEPCGRPGRARQGNLDRTTPTSLHRGTAGKAGPRRRCRLRAPARPAERLRPLRRE